MHMILFKKGIGKLKNISYFELQTLLKHMPCDWGCEYKCIYESHSNKEFNKYNVKFYRKND